MVKRVTLADVAQKADVSPMTVSRVLNNKGEISENTRQKVLQIVKELGYRPNRIARSLATNKTLKIGIVVPHISSAYYGAIFEGAENVLWEHGYYTILCNTGGSSKRERSIMNLFEEDRVDGVIVFSSHLSPETLGEQLKRQQAAIVLNCEVSRDVAGRIMINELNAMQMAVDYLVSIGRKNLAYVGVSSPNFAAIQRRQGFEFAVKKSGLAFDKSKTVIRNNVNWIDGCDSARLLLTQYPDIDGFVCFNDEVASGVVRSCLQMNLKVPEDVAVVGYDDIVLAQALCIPLTTLCLTISRQEVGEVAAHMLLNRIKGQCEQEDIILNHKLVIRDSAPQ